MSLPPCFAPPDMSRRDIPLIAVDKEQLPAVLARQPARVARWCEANQFVGDAGAVLLVPGEDGTPLLALAGIGARNDPLALATCPVLLPAGDYRLHDKEGIALDPGLALLGWGLGAYQYTHYRKSSRAPTRLVLDSEAKSLSESFALLKASTLVRDLVNTPTEDMGPDELEATTRRVAHAYGAECSAIRGDDLLTQNFPAIHAVGRASHRAPRLIELNWGDAAHPKLSIVGKGVCFDTGGLDVKPSSGMRNMKKDMGGAAHALALAQLVMARKLPVRLQLLLGAVENAIGPNAYRPGEVVDTRAGHKIEIDNTDAEGRVVLCDAMAYAAESSPSLMLDFATLTGAVVSIGGDVAAACFGNNDRFTSRVKNIAECHGEPMIHIPMSPELKELNDSDIADIKNTGGRLAGSTTAAWFLRAFAGEETPWVHVDIAGTAYRDRSIGICPKGASGYGVRTAVALAAEYAQDRSLAK